MAEIKLTRDKVYADRLRKYQVFIDDKIVGKIASGETQIYQVDEGQHTIQVKIDWCKTAKITFIADQKAQFFDVTSNLAGWKFLLSFLYAVLPSRWIILTKVTTQNSI